MIEVINKGPPADGGYPADSDLHQMSDDGCPLSPDPARWADPEWRDDPAEGETPGEGWRDNLGVWDTFGDAPPPAARADTPWQMRQDKLELMERWRAACARMVGGGRMGPDSSDGRVVAAGGVG